MSVPVRENILGTEKIGTLLLKFSLPGIISMVINALYNIIDQIFIGQGVGYLGNGATNVIFPLTCIGIAFGLMIGDGAAAYISLQLGRGDRKSASRGAAAGMLGIIAAGCVLCVLYLIFLGPLCRAFGATDAIYPYAMDYGRIITLGIPCSCICCGFASIIRADGSPNYSMAGLLLGCALNLIFDPIFIFVFHWGVSGAAIATVIGQVANAILYLAYAFRMKSVKVEREVIRSCLPALPRLSKLGISSFISQMAVVATLAVQNNLLVYYGKMSRYGEDIPMTALGVTMKVFNIMFAIAIGFSGGAQPIWGYNYGARKFDRVKKTYYCVVLGIFLVMCAGFAVFQLAPGAVVSIFGTDSELYTEFAIKCLRIFLLCMPISALQMASCTFFQAVGRPLQASLLSLSRQILFMIPACAILCMVMGVEGALWSGPAADILSCLLTLLLLKLNWKKIFDDSDAVSFAD